MSISMVINVTSIISSVTLPLVGLLCTPMGMWNNDHSPPLAMLVRCSNPYIQRVCFGFVVFLFSIWSTCTHYSTGPLCLHACGGNDFSRGAQKRLRWEKTRSHHPSPWCSATAYLWAWRSTKFHCGSPPPTLPKHLRPSIEHFTVQSVRNGPTLPARRQALVYCPILHPARHYRERKRQKREEKPSPRRAHGELWEHLRE